MSIKKLLYPETDNKKIQQLFEIIRYLFAGGSAFVCDLATKTLFYSLILPKTMGSFSLFGFESEWTVVLSTTAGFTVGLIVNWLISVLFVFTTEAQKKQGKGLKPFLIYLAVSVVGLLVNFGVTQLGCNLFSITKDDTLKFMGVSCVAAGVALIWNYIGRKIFIYRGE